MNIPDCNTNNIICNFHTIPITDILTAGTILSISLGILLGYRYSLSTIIILIILLLILDIFIHPYIGIPNNISYYFNLGKKPPGWRI